jgi:RNA polymerase sigma-70 factor (ECF subfamily)
LNTFEEIYAEYYPGMFRVAKKMIGNQDGVPDVLQDVFTDLFYKLDHGHEIRNPKSWLYRATFNKCIDSLRMQKHFQPIGSIEDISSETDSTENHDLKMAIEMALVKLKPRDRMLAVLYSEGLSYKEMAEATGIRFASVGKLLSRTLEKIEKDFKDRGYELY